MSRCGTDRSSPNGRSIGRPKRVEFSYSCFVFYVVIGAIVGLWKHHGQDFSWAGLGVTLTAIPLMYVLARTKTKLAEQLGSRALRTDAVESVACGYLATVVVIGLAAQRLLGAWWIDGVTSLFLAGFLVKEGLEAWEED